MSEVRTLRPGLLVSMKTSVGGGNVQYQRRDVENLHVDENGQQRSVWETSRIVIDPDEQAQAIKIRGKVRSLVTSVCTQSSFGLLCPNDREQELKDAVVAGRQLAWEFNQNATQTQIAVNVIYGRVAQDDVEAVAAISAELRDLTSIMEQGVAELNVKKIRDAAQKMRDTGQMLSADVKRKVDDIVAEARRAARKIAKAGEQAAVEVDEATLATLRAARTAFLDLDSDQDDLASPAEWPSSDLADDMRAAGTRAIDFDAFSGWDDPDEPADPAGEPAAVSNGAPVIAIDMEDDWQLPPPDGDTTDITATAEGM